MRKVGRNRKINDHHIWTGLEKINAKRNKMKTVTFFQSETI